MSGVITKADKKKGNNINIGIVCKKQKRHDWDYRAYHDTPSAIYCAVAQ